jgi:predicted phosphodiesterase
MKKVGIVIPDQHFPIHDKKAYSVVLQAIEHVKPEVFINLGDVGEWTSVNGHRYKRRKRPPLEYQLPMIDDDIQKTNAEIDRVDKVLDKINCKERYILAGNHDEWLDAFVEENPYLPEYSFRKACKWDERGYKYLRYNEVLTLGKANFIHGAYCGLNHAKKHLDAYGVNLIYGHTHDIQRYSATRLQDGNISAWSMGCLKNMSAEKNRWLKGRLHNWNHSFGIITWFKDNTFQLDVIDIIKGKANVYGEFIKG